MLDALLECELAAIDGRVSAALNRGLAFYERNLLLPDGTPKYYENGVYPIDSQCVAQAIQTFALATLHGRDYEDTAWRVFLFAARRMRRSDGAFIFQRRRYWAEPNASYPVDASTDVPGTRAP